LRKILPQPGFEPRTSLSDRYRFFDFWVFRDLDVQMDTV